MGGGGFFLLFNPFSSTQNREKKKSNCGYITTVKLKLGNTGHMGVLFYAIKVIYV